MHEYVEKLNQIKDEKKKSVKDIATELGMNPQLLALILLGEVIPAESDIERIAEYVIAQI
jgi:transcriptional regulator with XRE-family HTH domain